MENLHDKSSLRKSALKKIKALPPLTVDSIDVSDAECVLAYIPLKTEIDIRNAVDRWLKDGIKVGFPTDNPYCFASAGIDWRSRLIMLENRTQTVQTTEYIDINSICKKTVIIVPGLLFTKDRKRLGRGLGFYDRVLSAVSNNSLVRTLGVCRTEQLVDNLPMENTDRTVDVLLVFQKCEVFRSFPFQYL